MRYLCGTSSLSLCFGIRKSILCGYIDSDMTGDVDTYKSTSGYFVTFAGGVVSWQSRLQKCVALSITEAELIAAVEACKELLWMRDSWANLVVLGMCFIATVKVLFILARILHFMIGLNSLM